MADKAHGRVLALDEIIIRALLRFEDCPRDAVVYLVLVVHEVKFTTQGVKNLLQRWQVESGVAMNNVKPLALTD